MQKVCTCSVVAAAASRCLSRASSLDLALTAACTPLSPSNAGMRLLACLPCGGRWSRLRRLKVDLTPASAASSSASVDAS
eukprot:scaffold27212_cov59-Phaeocystis_antarctica.AAC.5